MLLKIDLPWIPIGLRGNYLTWKNPQTGETRKTYISQGQLKEVNQDLNKFNKLKQGLGYPWQPVRYDGEYIYYRSSVSGLETKSFIPPELRDIAAQFLKASGEPGKAKVLTMTPIGAGKYEYIDRGNFTTLRDVMTAEDIAISPWRSHPYSLRQGIVTAVYEGNRIAVDGVVVSIRNTDTPIYAQDRAGWKAAKDYTTSLLLGKQVTLRILTDMSRNSNGDTLADVTVATEDVAGAIMMHGNAPVKSAEPEWSWIDYINTSGFGTGAFERNFAIFLKTGVWGTYSTGDKLSVSDSMTYIRALKQVFGETTLTGKPLTDKNSKYYWQESRGKNYPRDIWEGGFWDRLITDVTTDPINVVGGELFKLIGVPVKWLLKPSYLQGIKFLNSFERPIAGEVGTYSRLERLWRQSVTLPQPLYHITNAIGDTFNAMLGGLRDPRMLLKADKILKLQPTGQRLIDVAGKPMMVSIVEGGEKVAFVSKNGRAYTVAELRFYQDYYRFDRLGQSGDTGSKIFDTADKLFKPGQKASEYENARLRYSSFLDRLQKGDDVEQAFAHSEHYLIDYNPGKLTAFEEAYLYPNIPFYMFLRQNTILQITEFMAQPQTYAMVSKLLIPSQPTADEYSRLRDYQKGQILIRNPADPTSFIRFRLPFENINALATSLSTSDKAVLLLYPWLSMFPELMQDRNYFDNTKPSKNYPLYFVKKFSSRYYFQARDYATMPLPEFLLKQLGIDAVRPSKPEYDISTILQEAGYAKTMEQLDLEATQRNIKYEARRSANVQNMLAVQTAIRLGLTYNSTYIKEDGTLVVQRVEPTSPGKPDRPVEFSGWDYINILGFMAGAFERNVAIAIKTRDPLGFIKHEFSILWGSLDGQPQYYTLWDKVSPSDTNTFIRLAKQLTGDTAMTGMPIEAKNAKYYWQESRGINYKSGWEGGFWDRLSTDIALDPSIYIAWGKDPLAKTLQWGNKELQLTSKGEKLYNSLRATQGEHRAREITIEAAKDYQYVYAKIGEGYRWITVPLGKTDLQLGKGLRVAGTDFEIPYSAAIASGFWKYVGTPLIIQPVKYLGAEISSIGSDLVNIFKDKIGYREKVELPILDDMLHEMQNRMRSEIQARKADIYILQNEAAEIWGTGYQRIVQKLLEDEAYRNAALWEFPRLKPVVDALIMRNYNIASMEIAWKLLTVTRTNYIFHEMMPQAIEAIAKGTLKIPTAMDTASGREMLVAMGKVLNPYNLRRAIQGTVEEINAWSMKENGMQIFFEDAFGVQRTREELHVTSIAVRQLIGRIGKEFGKPLGAFGTTAKGYGISSIKQLENVQLPKEVIRWLESADLIKYNVPELLNPPLIKTILQIRDIPGAQKATILAFKKTLQLYDFVQRVYKIGITFGSPAWLQGNIQSGLWVDAKYAKTYSISPYTNAWTEIARGSSLLRWIFKMSEEGKVYTDIHGTQITAKELLKEMADAGNLHSQGMTDIGQFTFGMGDSPYAKGMKVAYWALGNSEDIVRVPLYFRARLQLGRSAEEANKIVTHYHGDYSLKNLSPFERNVARRLLNFYVWDKFAPTLAIKEGLVNPSSFTIPYHVMTTWNGQQGVTDKQYFTDRQMVSMIFKIPSTDAYVTPAIFSLSNSVFKYAYTFNDKERGFYWEELHKDPNLILRFIKNDIDFRGGKVTIEGDKAMITYVETGDSITAQLNSSSNKLTFTDWTGTVLREYPTNTIDGKVGVYKQLSTTDRIERVMAELGAAALRIPIELAVNQDFRFNNPITDRFGYLINQFIGPRSAAGRGLEEYTDATKPTWEKWADMAIGWYVSHLSHNPMIPQQDKTIEDAVAKVVNIEVWKLERGNVLGCGD